MIALLIVLLSLLVVSFILLHVQLFDFKSTFSNGVVNFLLIIGGYALYVTHLKTIYILPILFFLANGILLKKFKFSFSLKNWKITFFIVSLVAFVFVVLFWRSNQLLIIHEDYLFWIRVGIMNQKLGVENINVFYNLMDSQYNGMDFYHYLELWCMDFGNLINGQSHAINLFLFAYPLAAIIGCFGIKELLDLFFNLNFKGSLFLTGSVAFVFIGLAFFNHPWDGFNHFFGIKDLPISSMSAGSKSLKFFYILIVVIALLRYLKDYSSINFTIMIFSLFFYIPVFPLVMLTISFWFVFLYFKSIKIPRNNLYTFVLLLSAFIAMYAFFGNHKGTTISGFSITELLSISYWKKILPAIIMKSIIIPIIGFSPFLLMIFQKRKLILKSKSVIFLFFLYVVCMSVWIFFVKNIDANQSFLLLFGVILPLGSSIIMWYVIFFKRNFLGIILAFIYVLPGISNAYYYRSPLIDDSLFVKDFVANLKSDTRLLFIPNKTDLTSVFDFNERVYTGINQFVLYNSKIVLMSFPGAIKIDTTFLNYSSYPMYEFYRNNSPYYSKCGFIDFSNTCFYDFLNEKHIDVICSKEKDISVNGWYLIREIGGYYFYIRKIK